jgi:hypothetical protein
MSEKDALREMLGLATDHSGDMLDALRQIAGRPDVAAILRGEAVAVPVGATEEEIKATAMALMYNEHESWIVCWHAVRAAMLATSPYKREQNT